MKILFLMSSMEGGGAERVAALLANAWAIKGHSVMLMPTFSARGTCVYPLHEAVDLTFLSDLCRPDAGRVTRLALLRNFIKNSRPDVIVSFLPHVNVAALLATIGVDVPVVACERTFPPAMKHQLPTFYRILRGLAYPLASALVGQTEQTAQWLREIAPRALVTIIPNPVVNPLPSKSPIISPNDVVSADRKLILWAGRLDSPKRAGLLIEAFKKISDSAPEWDVCLLGSGPKHSELQQQIDQLGLTRRIFLPGFAGNMGDWYQRADIYVMTSSFEGFPNTLLEALAHGVPSVAFDVMTGPRELSDGGRRFMLLPDRDHVEVLKAALATLIANPVIRQKFALEGTDVSVTYSEDAILAKWDELLSLCVASSPAPETEF